ncbi:response regulator [Glutamicibacter sp. MNS18]|uniref:response regulator n=1 Tax=Glutamicibacter sp. MNS18 TaxID=2989817 RepID=UPI0022366F31|nr:response regulator [Glutamicibacter sp. MNS18]MCW4465233.1 response regulator [Glutamicibacter sp. MNS18]
MSDKSVSTLIIDDDPQVAGIHQGFLLAHSGFSVLGVAHTGTEGLEKIEELDPQLVLLDIHLPDINGLQVLQALRQRPGGELRDVFAITADAELSTVRSALAGGVTQYLVKPFSPVEFKRRLDEYLATRQEMARHESTGTPLPQQIIDKFVANVPEVRDRRPVETNLPKGLSHPTLDLVCGYLREHPDDHATIDVAEALGLARVSVRRYLEFLVTEGLASRIARYGSAGRPQHRYRWNS